MKHSSLRRTHKPQSLQQFISARRLFPSGAARLDTVSTVSKESLPLPASVVIASSVACTLAAGVILFGLYKWWKHWRSVRRRARISEEFRGQHAAMEVTRPSASDGILSSGAELNDTTLRMSAPSFPPILQLSPGWPFQNSMQEDEKRSRHAQLLHKLLVDARSNVEDEDGRRTPSTVEAIAGSTMPSAAPSRAASTSTHRDMAQAWEKLVAAHAHVSRHQIPPEPPSADGPRRLSSDSHWSWSHRATYQETNDVEPLPAYSARRSRSLTSLNTPSSSRPRTRSRSRSQRSSALHTRAREPSGSRSRPVSVSGTNHNGGLNLNPPEYPLELARKVIQAYPRATRSPPLPPPGYGP